MIAPAAIGALSRPVRGLYLKPSVGPQGGSILKAPLPNQIQLTRLENARFIKG